MTPQLLTLESSKSDSSKMVLEVQDTKQNYKTKGLEDVQGRSMPQMSLVKRREKSGKVKKIQTPRRYKKSKLKSQLDMTTQGSLKSKHNNKARLHNQYIKDKTHCSLQASWDQLLEHSIIPSPSRIDCC